MAGRSLGGGVGGGGPIHTSRILAARLLRPTWRPKCSVSAWRGPRHGRPPNKTSNQTSGRSLVCCPRLPVFASFSFRFPFRGEKGSAPQVAGEGGGRGALLPFCGRLGEPRPRKMSNHALTSRTPSYAPPPPQKKRQVHDPNNAKAQEPDRVPV